MDFLISVDLEGVACAVPPGAGTVEDAFNIEFVRRQATREANAAATTLFANGANRVILWDSHGRGNSLAHDELDKRCEIALGSTVGTRFPGLDSGFAGVLFIGCHAREGTPGAAFAHSYSSGVYADIRVEGESFGELGIDGMIAGQLGVPVVFASGDDKACEEAAQLFPWAKTAVVKRSLADTRVVSLHPAAAEEAVAAAVAQACKSMGAMRPFQPFSGPVELTLRYKTAAMASLARLMDNQGRPFTQPDAYTRQGVVRDVAALVHYL